ncbi:hypothetical protein AB833_30815 [Chromatiales bacterium (ex Bugula neritina AB1)]|nr:hypothetical protein AB833_30815 [Chromatiales bacterium (ex Bugula neritina AB1)]
MTERLQKLLARAGLGSRRKLEADIVAGQMVINGKPAVLGDKAAVGDRIRYADRRYRVVMSDRRDFRLIAYHKPVGRVTTRSDEQRRPTVFDHLPRLRESRWVAIGRLDINTSGLLLFTDNGDLAHGLMHPSSEVEREYACRIRGPVSDEDLRKLHEGIELDDGPARFQRCWFDGGTDNNQWYRVVLTEGRNREVRRMWMELGYQVSRLIRVRYGPVELPGYVRAGKFVDVEDGLVTHLQSLAGLSVRGQAQMRLVPDTVSRGRRGGPASSATKGRKGRSGARPSTRKPPKKPR